MSIHTKHSAGDCEVCAAQQEADALGAIPTAGHQSDAARLNELAGSLASTINHGALDDHQDRIRVKLIAFAEEIKRQAVEP